MGKHRKKKKKTEKGDRKPAAKRKNWNERIEIDISDFQRIIDQTDSGPLARGDREKLQFAIETLHFLTQELDKKRVSVQRLKKMLFGDSTETTRNVQKKVLKESESVDADTGKGGDPSPKKKRKGHGRNGADAYTGAKKVEVPHDSLKPGDPCPECPKGKVYETTEPGRIVRVTGRAPIDATVYELEKFRCNLCGVVFTAKAPEGVGDEKYDAEAKSMIALLKYGSGLPFNRMEKLEMSLGIPLPAATQWDILNKFAMGIGPAFEELIRQAAQGEVLHNDDTTMKILELMALDREQSESATKKGADRKGVFTTGIVSKLESLKIALFFTGRRHAGENLVELLKRRASMLDPPIQMCDALSRNMPDELETIMANCLTHGRRKFVDVAGSFPEECLHVLKILKRVYINDAVAKKEGMSSEERLRFHKDNSGPKMKELDEWMAAQIDEKKVEPNSGLGEAINYMQNHWDRLTLFLRVAGAPLDNSICERALKKAILNRKNAYFYKTENGARVGDLFMSLIHTCELNGVNPFDYLTELQKHRSELASSPSKWMPWNYHKTLKTMQEAAGNSS